MIDTPKYLTVAECLERLPLRVSEREFRREVRELGLCYRRGQIITLSEDHLAQYIKTLEAKPCPTSSSIAAPAPTSGKSAARSRSRIVRVASSFDKARALLD